MYNNYLKVYENFKASEVIITNTSKSCCLLEEQYREQGTNWTKKMSSEKT